MYPSRQPDDENIIKWLEKLREYENRQEKGEKHDKSVLVIDTPENAMIARSELHTAANLNMWVIVN